MEEIRRFDILAREQNLLARRYRAGEQLVLGENALMANLEPAQPVFLCVPPHQRILVPERGRWFAVSLQTLSYEIALSRLGEYSVSALPSRRFRLGFHGTADAFAAHVAGLQPLLRERDSATPEDLVQALHERIHAAVLGAVPRALGPDPEYGEILLAKPGLEREVGAVLFPLFYSCGLCMTAGFHIEGFARPAIKTD